MRCTSCGTDNNDNQNFCRACGTPLNQVAPQQVGGPVPIQQFPQNPQVAQQMPVQPVPMNYQQPVKKKSKIGKIIGIIAIIIVVIFVILFIIGLSVINSDHLTGTYRCSLSIYDDDRNIVVSFHKNKEFSIVEPTSSAIGTFSIDQEKYNSDDMIKTYQLTLTANSGVLNGQAVEKPYMMKYVVAVNEDGVAAMMNQSTSTILYCIKS